jgi:hypothetical protein
MNPARYLRDAAVFAPCYLVLDWASYIAPLGPFNITPWNPQPALAIVWMLLGGLHHLPVVTATLFVADVLIRSAPAGYAVTLLTAVALSAAYAGIAWALRLAPRFDAALRTPRDLTQFAAIVLAGTAAGGAVFVGVLAAAAPGLPGFVEPWLRFWTGDAVGVLVTAPLLLVAADAERRSALRALLRRPEAVAQMLLLAGRPARQPGGPLLPPLPADHLDLPQERHGGRGARGRPGAARRGARHAPPRRRLAAGGRAAGPRRRAHPDGPLPRRHHRRERAGGGAPA